MTRFDKIYQSRLLLLLGDASYSIYLSHQFPMMFLARLQKEGRFNSLSPDLVSIIEIVVTICIGVGGYLIIERPLIERLSKLRRVVVPSMAPTGT